MKIFPVRLVTWMLAAVASSAPAMPQIVVDDHVVETKADGACVGLLTLGTSQRYVDCLNGTVWDTQTGLLWLQRGSCLSLGPNGDGSGTWAEAMEAAATVGDGLDCFSDGSPDLTDGSQPGDWRLPTRWEWLRTTQRAKDLGCVDGSPGGAPSLTNDAGDGCFTSGAGTSFAGVVLARDYWSSTSPSSAPGSAYGWSLVDGNQVFLPKSIVPPRPVIWPVREAPAYDGGVVVAVDGAPVETGSVSPCYGSLSFLQERYLNCGDGTVLDSHTNLLWLLDATCASLPANMLDYLDVTDGVAELADGQCGLTDGSQPGDWRLPTEDEWDRTTERAVALGCTTGGAGDPPALTNTAGTDCLAEGSNPFLGLEDTTNLYFWTSQTWYFDAKLIRVYRLDIAAVFGTFKDQTGHDIWTWPVRPRGPR